jgi:hypothetical protein
MPNADNTPEQPEIPNPQSINEVKTLIRKHGLESGSDGQARKLLVEGFELIQKRREYNAVLKEERGIDLDVDSMRGWVDNMIERQLGGRRHGDKIKWSTKDGEIMFDPISGDITCEG